MAEQQEKIIYFKDQIQVPIEDKDTITNNPEGLTVEGCKFNVKQCKNNKYIAAKYDLMLHKCKNFSSSGKLSNGKTVLSRDKDGNVTWAEMINEKFDLVSITKPIQS